MTIARQFELTLLGDAGQKREIIDGLQGLGVVHLVPLHDTTGEPGPDGTANLLLNPDGTRG